MCCAPKLTLTQNSETTQKLKGFIMLAKNSGSNNLNGKVISPWLDTKYGNLIKDEFQLAKEKLPLNYGAYFQPLPLFKRINDLGGEKLLFRGLGRLAPMLPLIGYNGDIAIWTSPPPSGLGNTIFIVMGHDCNNQLRLVGGNWFTDPKQRPGTVLTNNNFFTLFDQNSQRQQMQLVKDVIEFSTRSIDLKYLQEIRATCEHFHTMPIYIVVLENNLGQSLFQACPAVIEGVRPSNMSFEFFGEIK